MAAQPGKDGRWAAFPSGLAPSSRQGETLAPASLQSEMVAAASLQSETLTSFAGLLLLESRWPGKLVLSCGFDLHGMALAFAVMGAGGACLTLEADSGRLRTAGHAGASDFTVGTLNEALRILKNELRKGAPVSVALRADPGQGLRQILRRGVQPHYVAARASASTCDADALVALDAFLASDALVASETFVALNAFVALEILVALGAFTLNSSAANRKLMEAMSSGGWQMQEDVALNPVERSSRDAVLSAELDGDSSLEPIHGIARRWMQLAPRLFPRDRSRAYLKKELKKART